MEKGFSFRPKNSLYIAPPLVHICLLKQCLIVASSGHYSVNFTLFGSSLQKIRRDPQNSRKWREKPRGVPGASGIWTAGTGSGSRRSYEKNARKPRFFQPLKPVSSSSLSFAAPSPCSAASLYHFTASS